MDDTLTHSESVLTAALDALGEGVVVLDRDQVVVYLNQRARELLGVPSDIVGNQDWQALLSAAAADASNPAAYSAAGRLRAGEFVVRLVNRKTPKRVRLRIAPIGEPQGGTVVALAADAGAAMSEQEAVLRIALESSRLGIWEWDVERNRLTEHGEREPRLEDYEISSPIEWPDLIRLLHPDDLATIDTEVRGHLRGLSETMEMEIRLRRRDGAWGEFLIRGRALERDRKGHVARVLGTYTDVTERKAQERRLQLALENGHQGLWEWQPDADHIWFSREWYAMFGYREGTIVSHLRDVQRILHPDDAVAARAGMLPLLRGNQDSFEIEHRLRHADGHYIHILSRARVLERDERGRATRVIGTHVDITELKNTEARLIESRRLLETVIDAFPQRVFWKDLNNRYLGCNQLFAADAGAGNAAELLGKRVSDIAWPASIWPILDGDRQLLDSSKAKFVHQYRFQPVVGAEMWVETTKVPIHAPGGEVMGILGIYDDISERRRHEQQMKTVADAFTRTEQTRLLDALTEAAATLSGADIAFVARLESSTPSRARVTASYPGSAGLANWCYDVAPTPCAGTLDDGHFFLASGAAAAFPDDAELGAWGIEAYAGQRLVAGDGEHIGLFVLLFTAAQSDETRVRTVIDIFAARATSELERERTDTILRASEQRLNAALEGGQQGIWEWDIDHDRLAVLGQPFRDLEPGLRAFRMHNSREVASISHPQDYLRGRQVLRAYLRGRTPSYEFESRVRHPDGSYRWVLVRGHAADRNARGRVTRMIGTVTDISAQKSIQAELESSQHFLELIVGTVPQAVFWQDREFRYLGCNERFAQLARVARPADLIALGDDDLWWSAGSSTYREQDRELLDGRRAVVQSEIEIERGSGDRGWFELTKVPMRAGDGQIIGILGTIHDITNLKLAEEAAQHLALFDPLTGLGNRRYLSERLDAALGAATRRSMAGALLFIDMDQFKQINDNLGHAIGDALLAAVAERLEHVTRQEDTVARIGGDEFVVLLPELARDFTACAHQAKLVADKIHHALGEAFQFDHHQFHVTPTIGISLFPEPGKDTDVVLREADTAMYSGKAAGRNVTRFFHHEMEQASQLRLQVETDLRHAIEREQLELYYQPQLDRSGDVTGAEVLLRWHHHERGLVAPAEFIPIAEESGLIIDIGHWVLDTTFSRIKAWMEYGINVDEVAINLSSRQFRADDFVGDVERLLVAHRMPPHRVVFEITERTVIENVETAIDTMARLRRVGIRFAIDDFGVGYSSLSYLKRLPIDQLKIDRSFVADIGRDQNNEVICQTIIAMSQHLGLQTIAEGVETAEQFEFLARLRCNRYQGHLFAPAGTEKAFLRYHAARAQF